MMEKNTPEQTEIEKEVLSRVAQTFKILGDPTRIRILNLLSKEELSVNEIVDRLGLKQSNVSHQLKALRNVQLVKYRREGTTVYYSYDDEHVINTLEQMVNHVRHS
ncbi:MAG: metalloregulator ArsR/SmtB family transcription factor [Alkalibacterium sp.]|uniref:DNA-binding transcriptional regulator, ArsR family n=1 Tax=Alkalibacterium gilvum TaxID=1130080 RepID=A0A1H6TYQ6_9LACT|nr:MULTISPECIES: metalloregulator ArsR/SmtB family transcription factor [Alkalibacterium]MDN6193580.1 metalloregulator ArsR/SmtB family transcription factor [Alkalibacterium sp.]MDN6294899.1 metalloregulator ArsR/SmtB family transcription factor [Alkalibacterium sp.]MDN6326537.1 metalloregulator ArsR/SmtB family transcription factor [Alkalibacterium sp.]MDN6398231.1 metalloregulator ArsR/SmtB family transcription factor [Alkalibacterium sp.]MDN6729412.1 metalloregulator ArsR/SmtB family transc